MGRPPSNGSPAFRFAQSEVAEMETILQEHNNAMPAREVLIALSEKFSNSTERQGKIVVQMKQVWNWFQNKRYAIRAKSAKAPAKLSVSTLPPAPSLPPVASMLNTAPVSRDDFTPASNVSQAVPAASGRMASDSSPMEFEAKSVRDGAWYDVANFLAIKNLETGDPEVLVRFAGFGQEEDEWVNVKKHVRQRSLPCESSECVVVLPGDLILCFQEGKEQALYFDAHVLDAQRRRHDVRGCRCRFLVRYDHDQSEEIVPLRKICRRPETDYRLQQLHTVNESATADPQKTGSDPSMGNTTRVTNSQSESAQIPLKPEENVGAVAGMNPAANANANANANAPQAPIALANADVFAAPNTTQVPISPAKPYIPATNSATEAPIAPTSTNVPAANSMAQAPISPGNANVPATTKTISQELKTSETGSVSDTGNSDVPPGAAPLMGGSGIGTVTSSITENVSEGKE